MVDFDKLREKLTEALENLTEEDRNRYFPESTTPKGWIDIEDELPMMMALDIVQGCTEYRVKFSDGTEGSTCVSDHNTWYVYAKQVGITHWFND